MASSQTLFTTAEKVKQIANKQKSIETLNSWNADLVNGTASISVKFFKTSEVDGQSVPVSIFLEEPLFQIRNALLTPLRDEIARRVSVIEQEIVVLTAQVESEI